MLTLRCLGLSQLDPIQLPKKKKHFRYLGNWLLTKLNIDQIFDVSNPMDPNPNLISKRRPKMGPIIVVWVKPFEKSVNKYPLTVHTVDMIRALL